MVCQFCVDIVCIQHACMTRHLVMSDTSRWSLGLEIVIVNRRENFIFNLDYFVSFLQSELSHNEFVQLVCPLSHK